MVEKNRASIPKHYRAYRDYIPILLDDKTATPGEKNFLIHFNSDLYYAMLTEYVAGIRSLMPKVQDVRQLLRECMGLVVKKGQDSPLAKIVEADLILEGLEQEAVSHDGYLDFYNLC